MGLFGSAYPIVIAFGVFNYAWARLADTTLALVSAFNALCCLIALVLAVYKRLTRHYVV